MKYRIGIYCPDEHIEYNESILDTKGVGGGVTSRIRMAHALAHIGHEVVVFVNCPEEEIIHGVKYQHFTDVSEFKVDVLIASTSGGGLDLSPLEKIKINAKLRILMAHGLGRPTGIAIIGFDYLYALSNYMRKNSASVWGFPENQIFVSHRGVSHSISGSSSIDSESRDKYAICYVGHPSKGLDHAVQVLDELYKEDERYSLHIYGGYELWGETGIISAQHKGIINHGILGQRDLQTELSKRGFGLFLQSRQEPFGISLIEAMRAGCVVIASSVGAFPEIIRHGINGYLTNPDSSIPEQILEAVEIIQSVIKSTTVEKELRTNAIASPLEWTSIAQAWEQHWDWILSGKNSERTKFSLHACGECGGEMLIFSDGNHCSNCGNYSGNREL